MDGGPSGRRAPARAATLARFVCRPVPALLVSVVVLWAATLALDPGGFLGTDTGGKVATLEAMAQRPLGLDPDIGWWASSADPEAELHGLVYTVEESGRYVNVTTLPMVELGAPLYRVGGYRLALLLPILGCVACAFAARALARRLGAGDQRAWLAYWVVVVASPLTVYALDFWEHAPGVALVAWGVVALLDVLEGRPVVWRSLLAGAAFGAAFSMRTEALVYGFVATLVLVVTLLLQRSLTRALGAGALVAAGLGALVAANTALERAAIGSAFRTGRASGNVSSGGAGLTVRAKEAVLTAFGLQSGLSTGALLGGAATSVLLVVLVVLLVRRAPGRQVLVVGVLLGGLVMARVLAGPGFVPGLLPTAPVAALGLVVAWARRDRPAVRYVALVALASLPLVWLFQYTGGAGPQWGGRYILVSSLLLVVLGVVGLDLVARRAAVGLLVASLVVTGLGVGWLVIRSHEVADAARTVAALPEPVVISTEPFWLRELAAEYEGSRWISVGTRAQLDRAASIVSGADLDSFALIEATPGPDTLDVPGFVAVSSRQVEWLDEPFRITSYERSP